jgi:enolase
MVLALNVLDKSRRSAPSRTDRVAKYNHLLALEEAIGATAQYPDATLFIT